MARIRTIKPEFWTDERLTECSLSARLMFIGMWNFADDNGNLAYSAKRLKMQIFPADSIDTQPLLDELLAQEIIIAYEVHGEKFIHIKGFKKHQVINRPSASKVPQPNFTNDSVNTHGGVTDGKERKGKEGKGNSAPNGAGGEPPGESEGKTPEELTKDELWAVGKSLLMQQGMPKTQCGSFVGKLVKDYGAEIVIEAVRGAVVERPADAASFLKAACMARKQEGGKSLIPWHATDDGVRKKGMELEPRLEPRAGETVVQFKQRVVAAVENGGKAPVVPLARISQSPEATGNVSGPPANFLADAKRALKLPKAGSG